MKYIIDSTGLALVPFDDSDRKAIENEVWSFVDFLENKLKVSDYDDVFDDNSPYDKYTYQEAKAKYEAWLKHKEKENVNEFLVGDEVIGFNGTYAGVVTKVYGGGGYLAIIGKYGFSSDKLDARKFRKTGRHFNEVEELLEKMRGEK